jgi:hypothetical protein
VASKVWTVAELEQLSPADRHEMGQLAPDGAVELISLELDVGTD